MHRLLSEGFEPGEKRRGVVYKMRAIALLESGLEEQLISKTDFPEANVKLPSIDRVTFMNRLCWCLFYIVCNI